MVSPNSPHAHERPPMNWKRLISHPFHSAVCLLAFLFLIVTACLFWVAVKIARTDGNPDPDY
jgi:heme/copper-type cytochrome/quinol oxidase subunit 2